MGNEPPQKLIGPLVVVDDGTVAPTDTPVKRHKAGPGRTTELTPRIQEIICATIAAGNYFSVAAAAAGISESTLQKWRRRGRRGEEPYAALNAAIEAADRDCEIALVAKVKAAADDDWRAAAMMLERKYPENWSREREKAAFGHRYDYPTEMMAMAFQININLGSTIQEKAWDEEIRRRRLAAIPAVDAADAEALELATPATKV
jgi:hypothetical protein